MNRLLQSLLFAAAVGLTAAGQSLYDFSAETIDGKPQNLSAYKGQVLLIVNTASKCGFTRQYAGMQSLYEKYKNRGFTVLGFPANNFNRQEPGTNGEIQQFCTSQFHITFPMFGKISVKGENIHPLYAWLTTDPNGGEVSWNFNKYLVGRDGKLIAHYKSRTEPDSPELAAAIEAALNSSGN
ncbi:MAG: glutathione peroxidase [Kiritimatiellales bacterium]